MRPVSAPPRAVPPAAPGFTLVEVLIALVIFSILLGIGIPAMSGWVTASKAASASEFYAEGFRQARDQAVGHNAVSRIVLTENTSNHQLDYQIDLCFPTPAAPCDEDNTAWSTATASAGGDPQGSTGFKSLVRSAATLPNSEVLQPTLRPAGATAIYYTSVGWVDTNFSPRLTRLELAPALNHRGDFPSAAIAVTLSGMVSKCDPTTTAPDSRACP